MKKILLILMLLFLVTFANAQDKTSDGFLMPLFDNGDTLFSGSKTDTDTSNHGLNALSLRFGYWLGRYLRPASDSLVNVTVARIDMLKADSTGYARTIDLSSVDDNDGSAYWIYNSAANYWTRNGYLSGRALVSYGGSALGIGLYMYPNTSTTSPIAFRELSGNGINYVGLKAPNNLAYDYSIILPADSGQDGYSLNWGSGGNLVWGAGAGGGESNTASNLGSSTVGVYKTKSSVDLQFKGLYGDTDNVRITDMTDSVKIGLKDTIKISRISFDNGAYSIPYIAVTNDSQLTISKDLVVPGKIYADELSALTGDTIGIVGSIIPSSSGYDIGTVSNKFRYGYFDSTITLGSWQSGFSTKGSANQILGMNADASGTEWKTVTGSGVTHTAGTITITGGGGAGGGSLDTIRAGIDMIATRVNDSVYTVSADTTNGNTKLATQGDIVNAGTGYLKNADSTTLKTNILSQVLKNADSTTLKNSLLKNADSTAIRNQSNALYLKNADSTSIRNRSNQLYYDSSEVMSEILKQDSLVKDPTGFHDRTSSEIAFTNSTHLFGISAVEPLASFDIYSAGHKYTITNESIVVDSTTGIHYIYYDSLGTLSQSGSIWKINSANIPVATVYYNATTATGILADERHGFMQGIVHEYLHETGGAKYVSGLTGTFQSNGDTLRITSGEWYDEDVEFTPSNIDTLRMFYRVGSDWKWTVPQRRYYDTLTTTPAYDNAGTKTALGTNAYSMTWIFATNDVNYPIVGIMGQGTYVTQALAEAVDPSSLSLGVLPIKEALLLYRVVWQRNGSAITWKSTTDYRALRGGSVTNFVATDHSALTKLDYASSGHTGFASTTDSANFAKLTTANTFSAQQTLSNNATSGTGTNLYFNQTIKPSAALDAFYIKGVGTATSGDGAAGFYRMHIVTADSTTDYGSGLAIHNTGRADNLYLGVNGIAGGATLNNPCGIGLDLNRSIADGVSEQSSTFSGYGLLGYDWTQTNSATPASLISLRKINSMASTNNLIKLQANKNALIVTTQGTAYGYSATNTLMGVSDTSGTGYFWEMRNNGQQYNKNGILTVYNMASGNSGFLGSSTDNWLYMRIGSAGFRLQNNGATRYNLSVTDTGNVGIWTSSPTHRLTALTSSANLNAFNFTNSTINTVNTTAAQGTDTSAIYGNFTGTGSPTFGLNGKTGNVILKVDSAGTTMGGDLTYALRHCFLTDTNATTPYAPDLTQNVYTQLAPTYKIVKQSNITCAGDTMKIVTAGSYYVNWTFTITGANAKDFRFAIRKNGVLDRYITITTIGTSNYVSGAIQDYFDGMVANDGISFAITCTTDGSDATFRSQAIYCRKEY